MVAKFCTPIISHLGAFSIGKPDRDLKFDKHVYLVNRDLPKMDFLKIDNRFWHGVYEGVKDNYTYVLEI
ncbi:UNVERIFIED_CONTAM: hypothetical protein NCL1_11026 [Trichonephila clavipes]